MSIWLWVKTNQIPFRGRCTTHFKTYFSGDCGPNSFYALFRGRYCPLLFFGGGYQTGHMGAPEKVELLNLL